MAIPALAVAFLLPALPVRAVERAAADVVLVDSGATISDDLYAAGNRVVVHGRVDGDLIASAFEDVTITGVVTGDVVALAARVVVTGAVTGSVRAVGGSVTLGGDIGGDLVALGWDQTIGGSVGGDAVVWGSSVTLDGRIGGDLEGQTGRLELLGEVAGNVDVTVDTLSVGVGAVVGGDLGYRSPQPSPETERAEVGGATVHRNPLPANIRVRALLVFAKVVMSLAVGVAGLLVMWAAPGITERATNRIRTSWWRVWLQGLAVLAVPAALAAAAVGLVAVAPLQAVLPVLGVLGLLLLAVLGAVAGVAMVAPAASYPWLGSLGPGDRSRVTSFLVGLALVTAGLLLPWVSWLVVVLVLPLGLGAWWGSWAETT